MTAFKIIAVAATITVSGFGVLAQVDPIAAGGQLGRMSVASILGVVAVTCVIAVVYLFHAKDKSSTKHHEERDKYLRQTVELVRQTSVAVQAGSEANRHSGDVLREIKGEFARNRETDEKVATAVDGVTHAIEFCKEQALRRTAVRCSDQTSG